MFTVDLSHFYGFHARLNQHSQDIKQSAPGKAIGSCSQAADALAVCTHFILCAYLSAQVSDMRGSHLHIQI